MRRSKLARAGCLLMVLLLQAMPSGAAQASCPCLPPPCPAPTATLDLTALCAQLDAIQAQIKSVQKEQEKKGPVLTVLGNRFVEMALAAAVAAVTVRVMR